MRREDVNKNNGMLVSLNGLGDLAMEGELKKYIYDKENKYQLKIIKLTKGGMVLLQDKNNAIISVPLTNIDLISESL